MTEAVSQTRCATCSKFLTTNERRSGDPRCGKCRYNSHGVRPTKRPLPVAPAAESWWIGLPREAFIARARAKYQTN